MSMRKQYLTGNYATKILISNFVEQVRAEQEQRESCESDDQVQGRLKSMVQAVQAHGYEDAQKRMEQAIIEAEKFNAAIETPPGRSQSIQNTYPLSNDSIGQSAETRRVVGNGLSDDDFSTLRVMLMHL